MRSKVSLALANRSPPTSTTHPRVSALNGVHSDELRPSADHIAELLQSLFNCQWNHLPIELFSHPFAAFSAFLRPVFNCLTNKHDRKLSLARCISPIFDICNNMADASVVSRCSRVIRALRDLKTFNDTSSVLDLDNATVSDMIGLDHDSRRNSPIEVMLDGMYQVPDEMSIFDRFLEHRRCLNKLSEVSRRHNCLPDTRQFCTHDKSNRKPRLVAVKLIRVRLADVERTIRTFPDLSVILLTRDPRAVAVSQYANSLTWQDFQPSYTNLNLLKKSKVVLARNLCARVAEDLRSKVRLDKDYPGAILTIRYEDFVKKTHVTARRMFRHVGHVINDVVLDKWINKYRFEDVHKEDGSSYDTVGENQQQQIYRWKKQLNETELNLINKYCRQVLRALNYKIY